MSLLPRIVALPLAALLFGCPGLGNQEPPIADTLPENPTWTEHVKPILDTYCNECHSDPPQQAAPGTLRLDICESLGKPGAQAQAQRIVIRMIDKNPTPMPPLTYAKQPTPDDMEVIRRWVEQGASCEGSTLPVNNGQNNQNNGMTIPPADMGGTNNMDGGMDMGSPDLGDAPWTFTEVADFLRTTCGVGGSCHGGANPQGGFALMMDTSDADLAQTLMTGMTAAQVPLISPNEPDASAIVLVLESGQMPLGGPARPEEAAKIRAWVLAGADYGL